MHRLVVAAAAQYGGQQAAALYQSGGGAERQRAWAFAESCLLSLALWRRFGSADFAEALGWIERTDYAAMNMLLPGRAVDVAVKVWRAGRHAVMGASAAQDAARRAEERAWDLGGHDNGGAELQGEASSPSLRSARATAAGEAVVRKAYERLLIAPHHPLWDIWRKRSQLVEAALTMGGSASRGGHCVGGCGDDIVDLREALRQVRGYCGPDPDDDRAGWELALDLVTLTPLAAEPGPVAWCPTYVAWLRRRQEEQHRPSMIEASRLPAALAGARPLAQRRPPPVAAVDLTGLSSASF